MKCLKCKEELILVNTDRVRYRECPGCFGRLVDDLALKKLVRAALTGKQVDGEALAIQDDDIVELAALVTESDSRGEVRCPRCMAPMSKERVHQLVPVNVDRCAKCQMTWLDAGELKMLQRLYYEMQTSDDPKVVRIREKIGMINLDRVNDKNGMDDAISSSEWGDIASSVGGVLGTILRGMLRG